MSPLSAASALVTPGSYRRHGTQGAEATPRGAGPGCSASTPPPTLRVRAPGAEAMFALTRNPGGRAGEERARSSVRPAVWIPPRPPKKAALRPRAPSFTPFALRIATFPLPTPETRASGQSQRGAAGCFPYRGGAGGGGERLLLRPGAGSGRPGGRSRDDQRPAHPPCTQQPTSPAGYSTYPGHRECREEPAGAVACRARELGLGDAHRVPRARGEHRRHTITNGVDCDLLKRMKELEQEQEVLLQGLEMMARGRDWYQQQLQRVQERQRRLGQSRTSADFGTEGSPLPLGRLLPKVQEVARCLGELLSAACASRALPALSSGTPAPASPPAPGRQQQTILMLKEQNRLLTQEVTSKSERITQLEQEKSALIKQLFEARALSQQEAGPLDSTFI
ncbi:suppressor APC domain-containing protein 2 [Suricata suricatta]|uniref:suppressor APC domain-containing protein 2 n=1 Tax=Suricata suricatta TaxID=37032 RepID=UPI00115545CF|nr:suppressor APC domain-containing protein 2 [Suricata suricatta]